MHNNRIIKVCILIIFTILFSIAFSNTDKIMAESIYKYNEGLYSKFGINFNYRYDDFKDLKLLSRKIDSNDLNLGFAFSSTGAEDKALDFNWKQNTITPALTFSYLAMENLWIEFGVGYAYDSLRTRINDGEQKFNGQSWQGQLNFQYLPRKAGSFGLGLNLLHQEGYADKGGTDIQIVTTAEKEYLKFSWKKTLVDFDLSYMAYQDLSYDIVPYLGIMSVSLDADMLYKGNTYSTTTSTTAFKYKFRNSSASSLRGVYGSRFWLKENTLVDYVEFQGTFSPDSDFSFFFSAAGRF